MCSLAVISKNNASTLKARVQRQKKQLRLLPLMIGLFFLSLSPVSRSEPNNHLNNVLILYDSSTPTPWVAYLNALCLANLIGHFDTTYTLLAVEEYKAREIEKHSTIFYLGVNYNNPLPKAFIHDVMHTTKNIVWFRYNLWQLPYDLLNKNNGLHFDYMDNTGFDKIQYKNTRFTKNKYDLELGHVTIVDNKKATVSAMALHTSTGNTTPYVVHAGNLWYIADIPFTYISENDRYLVFADLLHDMLEIPHEHTKRALLRLEDIDPETLKKTADYLYSQHVPFGISVIPYFKDPLGYTAKGLSRSVKMTDVPAFIDALKYMESKGGRIILHGYTHQYGEIENAFSGITGHDYEFFRVSVDLKTSTTTRFESLDEDSYDWVNDRVTSALSLLSQSGLSANIWETPHYVASDLDNRYFAQKFPAIIGRVLYFNQDDPMHHIGQFFPYVIQKDSYGQKILPENLGCISPVSWFNFPVRNVDDVVLSAKKNLVIRDAWASMYYHPYLGLSYLQQLIPEIKKLGYQFVAVSPELE